MPASPSLSSPRSSPSAAWWRALTARAAPLSPDGPAGPPGRDRRGLWRRWAAAVGGTPNLARRLRRSQWRPAWTKAPPRVPAAWTEPLEALWDPSSDASVDDEADQRVLAAGPPRPFDASLLPLVRAARQRLDAADVRHSLLTPSAWADAERALLKRLVRWAAPVLQVHFAAFRSVEHSRGSGSPPVSPHSHTPTRLYDRFVDRLRRGGWRSVLEDRPVLGRLLGTIVRQWIRTTTTLLRRLDADRDQLPQHLAPSDGTPTGRVVAMTPALSDPHHDGQSVALLTFEGGATLAYKPRDVALANTYGAVVRWISGRDGIPDLTAPRVMVRDGYGWMEAAQPAPCACADDVAAYYRRLGVHLALLHVLGGTDIHPNNVVAAGAQPQVIDLEGLLHPTLIARTAPALHAGMRDRLASSVLQTGLLPAWHVRPDGGAFDVSSGAHNAGAPRVLTWQHVNTDAMKRAWEASLTAPLSHRPVLDGRPVPMTDHAGAVVEGFRQGYDVLQAHRQTLLDPDGPLSGVREQTVRVLIRNTRTYTTLLRRAYHPRELTSGTAASVQLDALARPLLRPSADPRLWPVVDAEQADLARLDVPVFTMRADTTTLCHRQRPLVNDAVPVSPWDALTRRVARLAPDARDVQIRLLRHALSPSPASVPEAQTDEGSAPSTSATWRDQALGVARRVAASLKRHAFLLPSRAPASPAPAYPASVSDAGALGTAPPGCAWLDVQPDAETGRRRLGPLNASLYRGVTGVAVFLAAYARLTGDEEARRLAVSALGPVHATFAALDPSPADRALIAATDVGGGTGLGSVIYGLCTAGRLLDDETLLDAARHAARHVTPARLRADDRYDVMSGAAGALLGLLAVHAAGGTANERADVLARARQCGDALLDARQAGPHGLRAWPTLAGRLRTGASHGAAGIAAALSRLGRATGEARYRRAAREACRFEAACFDSTTRTWRPGDRHVHADAPQDGWCHGPTGVGLMRLDLLEDADAAAPQSPGSLAADLDAALDATMALGTSGAPSLCCGAWGRVDLLLTAGRRLDRPDLVATARRWTAALSRTLPADLNGPTGSPALFQGATGAGYQCLRVLAPETVPSVLRWA